MGQEARRSEFSWPSAQRDLLQPLTPAWGLHSPDSTHITIFLQTRYFRESRYLQTSMSMPGWMGSGSIVQKRLGKEKWAWGGKARARCSGPNWVSWKQDPLPQAYIPWLPYSRQTYTGL